MWLALCYVFRPDCWISGWLWKDCCSLRNELRCHQFMQINFDWELWPSCCPDWVYFARQRSPHPPSNLQLLQSSQPKEVSIRPGTTWNRLVGQQRLPRHQVSNTSSFVWFCTTHCRYLPVCTTNCYLRDGEKYKEMFSAKVFPENCGSKN